MAITDAQVAYDLANQPPATPEGVAQFLGRPGDQAVLDVAAQHLPLVATMVRGYTRGRGFVGQQATDELCAVIVTATARLVNNPTLVRSETIGTYSVTHSTAVGFTLPELFILNRYRKRAR